MIELVLSAIIGLNGLFCLSTFILGAVITGVLLSSTSTIIVDTPVDDA